MDIFEMFAESVPENLKKQAEEAKANDKKKGTRSKTGRKKDECCGGGDEPKEPVIPETEKKQITLPVKVFYAREEIEINAEEFSAEVIVDGKVSKDDIRRLLEQDFPELSKERTVMDYEEENNRIFPIVKATTKGLL